MKITAFIFAILQVLIDTSASHIKCISVINLIIWEDIGPQRTCNMTDAVSIDSKAVKIIGKKDLRMKSINFYENKKIVFLPIKVHEIFPNLESYSAGCCSIKEISYENFKGLSELNALLLQNNTIEVISTGTFKDLKSLEVLELDHNRIKTLNGDVFHGLSKLNQVHLLSNTCINEEFTTSEQIKGIIETVSKSCENKNDTDEEKKVEVLAREKTDSELVEKK